MDHTKSNPRIHTHIHADVIQTRKHAVDAACESAGYEYSEIANFLLDLRDSGITNMMAAPTFLIDEFDLSRSDARLVTSYWMDSCIHQYG